jgi:hypothetical protein
MYAMQVKQMLERRLRRGGKMLLIKPNTCVNTEKAIKYIELLCKDINFPFNKSMLTKSITYNVGQNKQLISFPDELQSIKTNGKANILQFYYDSNDQFLKLPPEMSLYTDGASGLHFNISSSYGSFSSELEGPGAVEAPETSLSYDIISSRNKCIESFNNKNYIDFNSYYRSFLFSSISLVDCFLHRYNFYLKENIKDTSEYDNLKELDSISAIDKRLRAWMYTFATDKIDEIELTKQWSQFMELKKIRNSIVHPTNPTISYSVKNITKTLNLAKYGIGGLLLLMRKYACQRELIGFIQSIYNVPEIRIKE